MLKIQNISRKVFQLKNQTFFTNRIAEHIEMASKEVHEFASSLECLVFDRNYLIPSLTSLAGRYASHAEEIVKLIEMHLSKVEPSRKLAILYLIDSIAKKHGRSYKKLFERNIAETFVGVYEEVERESKIQMIRLRKSWIGTFSLQSLQKIDAYITRPGHDLIPAVPLHSSTHVHDGREACGRSSQYDDKGGSSRASEVKLSESSSNRPRNSFPLQDGGGQSTSMDVDPTLMPASSSSSSTGNSPSNKTNTDIDAVVKSYISKLFMNSSND